MRIFFGLFIMYGFLNTFMTSSYYYDPVESFGGFLIGVYIVREVFDLKRKDSDEGKWLNGKRLGVAKWIYKTFFVKQSVMGQYKKMRERKTVRMR